MANIFVLASFIVLAAGQKGSILQQLDGIDASVTVQAAPKMIRPGQTDSITIACEFNQLAVTQLSTVTSITISRAVDAQAKQFERLVYADVGLTSRQPVLTDQMKEIDARALATINFGRHSELLLTWDSPKLQDAAVYECKIQVINPAGNQVEGKKTVEVKIAGEHQDDLRDRVDDLEQKLREVRSEIHHFADDTSHQFDQFADSIMANIHELRHELEELKKTTDGAIEGGQVMQPLIRMLASEFHISPLTNNTRYLVSKFEQVFSIDDAHKKCQEFGGHLVEIKNKNQLDFLLDLIRKVGGLSENFYTGAKAMEPGQASFVFHNSKQPVTYLPWAQGAVGRKGEEDDCLVIKREQNGVSTEPCSIAGKYVCEVPSLV